MSTANEEDFFEQLIAAERVDEWLDAIRNATSTSMSNRKDAAISLRKYVLSSDLYYEVRSVPYRILCIRHGLTLGSCTPRTAGGADSASQ